ncbi:MAG TPA: COX15/CtaA family protein [Alphaproteobacteria bacterium]|nr:COX15/CtaA family protein [Alphaproteobacteria bacterium]
MVAIRHRMVIATWLLICAAAVFAMVVIGGITRLTESGLSMVEWRPLMGTLPPMSAAEWDRIFQLYRQIPEYQFVNAGMSLAEFKSIFWWEYIHRAFGRFIGVLFAVPFLFFLIKGWLTTRLTWRLAGLFFLGGLQGVIGWWMVKSGLVDRTDVSQYRLAAHLLLALVILALLFYLAMSLLILPNQRIKVHASLAGHAWLVVAAIGISIGSGALVAGTDAGLIYNTFPLMGDRLMPAEYAHHDPFWLNWFENPAAVQFNHRWLAIGTFLLIVAFWWRAQQARLNRAALAAVTTLTAVACVQVGLGVSVLLTNVPMPLAATHQAVAVLLLLSALSSAFLMRFRGKAETYSLNPAAA